MRTKALGLTIVGLWRFGGLRLGFRTARSGSGFTGEALDC